MARSVRLAATSSVCVPRSVELYTRTGARNCTSVVFLGGGGGGPVRRASSFAVWFISANRPLSALSAVLSCARHKNSGLAGTETAGHLS